MQHFGAKPDQDPTEGTWTEKFNFGIATSQGTKVLEFNARLGKLPAGGLLSALLAAERGDETKAVKAYALSISKMIDDRDGLAARWQAEPLDQREGDERPPSFRVPWGEDKGKIRPMDEESEYVRSVAHSSRRRWLSMLEDDEDAMIDFGDLQGLFEWMVAQSTGNRSAASS